jgi:TPR repeat protein
VGHGPTIRNLVWEFCHGSCGIPENITAAIELAKKFPQYVSPGAKFYLSEWTNEVYLDRKHFMQVCQTGKCSQTLYYYYINYTRSSCKDDAKDKLAHNYLKKAATLGLAEAQYKLAEETWWENRDFHVCSELLQQAADQGHEYARKLLKTVKNQEISFPQW